MVVHFPSDPTNSHVRVSGLEVQRAHPLTLIDSRGVPVGLTSGISIISWEERDTIQFLAQTINVVIYSLSSRKCWMNRVGSWFWRPKSVFVELLKMLGRGRREALDANRRGCLRSAVAVHHSIRAAVRAGSIRRCRWGVVVCMNISGQRRGSSGEWMGMPSVCFHSERV